MAQQSFDQPAPLDSVFPPDRSIVPLEKIDASIDTANIQGDIYPTFPKAWKVEKLLFFTINSDKIEDFRSKLSTFTKDYVTTAAAVIEYLKKIQKLAFGTHAAFELLNIKGDIGEDLFKAKQLRHARKMLGDRPTGTRYHDVDWDPVWKSREIHGVIIIATHSYYTFNKLEQSVCDLFGDSIDIVATLDGKVRPGLEKGHEHFGFMDGISQPAITGFAKPHLGQPKCEPGVIIMGHDGDPFKDKRPVWAKDGSIMAFRKLQQLVPEFHAFVTPDKGNEELLGARMFGRWKSGAPVQLAPEKDDPAMAQNAEQNNNFDYVKEEEGGKIGQTNCPFSAHIRKMAPRNGFEDGKVSARSLIVRTGIAYGEELSEEEKKLQTTLQDRGLLFISYQSALVPGFGFLQKNWANNSDFPEDDVGLDPIIGNSVGSDRARVTTGQDPHATKKSMEMPCDFVVARGGEYFFVPSMETLGKLSQGEELVS